MPVWLQKPEMGWHQGDRDEHLVLGKARAMHWDPPPILQIGLEMAVLPPKTCPWPPRAPAFF